jgi:hypothetical protein
MIATGRGYPRDMHDVDRNDDVRAEDRHRQDHPPEPDGTQDEQGEDAAERAARDLAIANNCSPPRPGDPDF